MVLIIFVICIAILYLLVKLLQLNSTSEAPRLVFVDTEFNRTIVEACSTLLEPYIPTLLWGKSGHFQSIFYAKIGRFQCPSVQGERQSVVMQDGATITFDIFEPLEFHRAGDVTIVMCPGIGNSSQEKYIQSIVSYTQNNGFRVVCMNHLGAIDSLKLTAPRIYTYGGTGEFAAVVDRTRMLFPETKMIALGFSMGGNIVTKYLGEDPERQKNFIAAFSACQGYDIELATKYFGKWDNARRAYIYVIANHVKRALRAHSDVLFSHEAQMKYGPFDTQKIFKATSIMEIDELYTSQRAGYSDSTEFYRANSCKRYLTNIHIPIFILNAMDDPLVPAELLKSPLQFAESRRNVIYAQTAHGGHLGFFEGGIMIPDTLTWIDRLILQYCNAVLDASRSDTVLNI